VADLGARYVWIVLPGLYFHYQSMANTWFAMSQKNTTINLYMMSSGTIVHFILVMLFT
jgi:hypothetical protein